MNYNQYTATTTNYSANGDVLGYSVRVTTLEYLNTVVLLSVFLVFYIAFKIIFRRKRR